MKQTLQEVEKFLHNIFEKQVLRISALTYILNNEPLEKQQIQFWFDTELINFTCDSVGESLNVDTRLPQEIDMQNDGCLKIMDISQDEAFKKIINQTVEEIFIWLNPFSSISGVELDLSCGASFFIFNLGDSLWVFNEKPPFLDSEGYTQVREI